MKIAVDSYSAEWPVLFEYEKYKILELLDIDEFAIEHIGSTAVPGLSAKPIIDIMVGLEDKEAVQSLENPFASLGYYYIKYYEQFLPDRKFYVKDSQGISGNDIIATKDDHRKVEDLQHSHHLHVVVKDGKAWTEYMQFREALRTHAADRMVYELLKKDLKKTDWISVREYAQAKTSFVRMILARAR